ncbi:GIY-YIG nuclease family protein [Nocardia farcinica]|uniref:hypothetical protein n=1 Tax=Nocardia farcinica TaxID=37329 RepID=UPI0018950855|nr:hypothetical protein [Nocardia farcinica]MBF6410989.1 hypothetical protein [Nocardia farcinica]
MKLPMSIYRSGSSSHRDVPTSLYLYYDKFDVLLYVGITSRGIERNREHNSEKEWWQYVARQEVRHLPTRTAALRAERDLIIQLNPPFNKQHNPDHERLAATYRRFVEKPHPSKAAPQEHVSRDHLEEWETGLLHLDLVKRDGKFLHCRSRNDDVALATLLDLTATSFDRFKLKDARVGYVVSLSRHLYGFEAVLKGKLLADVTGVAVLVQRRYSVYAIHNLRLKVAGKPQFVEPTGISDPQKANVGKFSNGAQVRRKHAAVGVES